MATKFSDVIGHGCGGDAAGLRASNHEIFRMLVFGKYFIVNERGNEGGLAGTSFTDENCDAILFDHFDDG